MFRDPSRFCQIDSPDATEYTPLTRDNSVSKVSKQEERLVVKDLMTSLRNTRHAYAIAANQRGWTNCPIFICKQDPTKLSKLPPTHELASVLGSLATVAALREDVHVFKNPKIELLKDSTKYHSRESCLSKDGLEYSTERYTKIILHTKMLDLRAYRANKSQLTWIEVAFELEGLGAQIIQHEVDHLYGCGIWDFALNYTQARN